jgi:hypothetical protein
LEQERLILLEQYQRALISAPEPNEEAKVDQNGNEVLPVPNMTEQQKNELINLQIRLIDNQQLMLNR